MSSSTAKSKVERSQNGPLASSSKISPFKFSSPTSQSSPRVVHVNERKSSFPRPERAVADTPSPKKEGTEVQQVEKKLLQLMEEFETGKLKAFGNDSRLRQMEEIREQQEKLARLHFDVGAEQDLYPPLSEEGLRISESNMKTLMQKLAELSESIENLHTNTHDDKKSPKSENK